MKDYTIGKTGGLVGAGGQEQLELVDPQTDLKFSVGVETITPKDAKQILKRNSDQQRRIRPSVVTSYAETMKLGLWVACNGEMIKIGDNGTLIDGQHRLMAVVECGLPIDFMVARGIHSDNIKTIDSGAKRTFTDVLYMGDKTEVWHQKKGTLARFVRLFIEIAEKKAWTARVPVASNTVLQKFYHENQWISVGFDEFSDLFSITKIQEMGSLTGFVAFWIIHREINRDLAFSILKTIENGFPFDQKYQERDYALAFHAHRTREQAKKTRNRANTILDGLCYTFRRYEQGPPRGKPIFNANAAKNAAFDDPRVIETIRKLAKP